MHERYSKFSLLGRSEKVIVTFFGYYNNNTNRLIKKKPMKQI